MIVEALSRAAMADVPLEDAAEAGNYAMPENLRVFFRNKKPAESGPTASDGCGCA
jgi:hypothetical protein